MNQFPLAVVMPDIRSAQNIGAILRTADAVGASLAITCGYTPHMRASAGQTITASSGPLTMSTGPSIDPRPPHVIAANEKAISKAALGAELTIKQLHFETLAGAVDYLRQHQYRITALEQSEDGSSLFTYCPVGATALILGNEVTGLSPADLALCGDIVEIPMLGTKESLNVSVAAGIALYYLRMI